MTMELADSLTLDATGLAFTRDGFLTGDAKVSRAGNVQHYLGRELGLEGAAASRVFGVYRDPATVFEVDSMMSLAGRPVTRGHPPQGVAADNWRELAVGQVGGRVVRDGEHVVASMAIMDAAAAKEVHDGARSLSAGYTVEIVRDEGIAPDGTEYQYRQASPLRFNHVAYLPDNNPRAGNTHIGDAHWGTPTAGEKHIGDGRNPGGKDRADNPERKSTMSNTNTRTVMVDGLPVECTDAAAIAIDKLQRQLQDSVQREQDERIKHQSEIEAKDAEIGELKADNKKLQDAQLKPEDLDRKVAARAELVSDARALAPNIMTEGVADEDIRKAAVEAVHGSEFVKDASPAGIAGMFRVLSKDAKADPVNKVLRDGAAPQPVKDNGYAASIADFNRNKKEA